MIKKAIALLLSIPVLAQPGGETVSFQVFSDPQCTQMLRQGASPNVPSVTLNVGECHIHSYTSPMDGSSRTNAFGRFHCTENSVTWTHWPQSQQCGSGRKVLVDTLYSDRCVPIQTHMGTTYQKLFNYNPCSAKYDYTGVEMGVQGQSGGGQSGGGQRGGGQRGGGQRGGGQSGFGGSRLFKIKKKFGRKSGGNEFGGPQFGGGQFGNRFQQFGGRGGQGGQGGQGGGRGGRGGRQGRGGRNGQQGGRGGQQGGRGGRGGQQGGQQGGRFQQFGGFQQFRGGQQGGRGGGSRFFG